MMKDDDPLRVAAREEARRQGQLIHDQIMARGVRKSEIARRLDMSRPNLSGTLKRLRDGRFTLKTLAKLGWAVGIYWDLKFEHKTPQPQQAEPFVPDGLAILVLAS